MKLIINGEPALCTRKACREYLYASHAKHKHTGALYCFNCRDKINDVCGEEVVEIIRHPKEDLKHTNQDHYNIDCGFSPRISLNIKTTIAEATCHDCLNAIVKRGDEAAARIIALDLEAGKTLSDPTPMPSHRSVLDV